MIDVLAMFSEKSPFGVNIEFCHLGSELAFHM
jgi:hypothetical protein